MDFKSFTETMKEAIRDYLPDEYKDATVEVVQQKKLNEQYSGLFVRRENQEVTPTINLDQLYEAYDEGFMSIGEALKKAAELVQTEPEGMDLKARKVLDYDKVKDKLFIRVSNADTNRDTLENAPHMIQEDLAVTYHVVVNIGESDIASMMVTNQLLEKYGITQEQLHADAMKSSPVLFPAKVESMSDVMKRMMMADMQSSGMSQEEMDAILQDVPMIDESPMTVVTNDRTVNGAAVIFYPDQMDRIAEKLEGDFFILPSSVHECLVIPDNGEFDFKELCNMVKEVNETQVKPSERLSDDVYHYDSKDRVFEKAASFDTRQKAKAVEKQHEMAGSGKEQNLGKTPNAPKKHKSNDMSL
jgi:hypothetical protein